MCIGSHAARMLSRVVLLASLVACSNITATETADTPKAVQLANGSAAPRFDPASIESAAIEGDLLRLQVRHGGGCEKHDFELLHSGVFLESNPVQARLDLAHDAHGDACRALVGARLSFDLAPLKREYQQAYAQQHGIVVLLVKAPGGPVTTIRYEF
jgi:hypothetical protein